MSTNTYGVTGSLGCIGAWVLYHLQKRGERVVSFDVSDNRGRLELLMDKTQLSTIMFEKGDLTRREQLEETLARHGVTHLIHLGALQVPFCRANPVLGAQVNVVGSLNVFEAALKAGLKHVVYASSVAVYGSADEYPAGSIGPDAPLNPHTLYGGYKRCNEQNARLYSSDYGLDSTALRPYVVYGVGRDQGMTSDPTKAMLAAAAGKPYHITFGGTAQLQLASDVAQQFVLAADYPLTGANVFNLGGKPVSMEEVVAAIQAVVPGAEISHNPDPLPFPVGFDDHALRLAMPTVFQTDLQSGVGATTKHFQTCLRSGRITYNDAAT